MYLIKTYQTDLYLNVDTDDLVTSVINASKFPRYLDAYLCFLNSVIHDELSKYTVMEYVGYQT
jgi:hypothetical protein